MPTPPRDKSEGSVKGQRPLGAIVSVVGCLAVVLGLFLGFAWLMRRSLPTSTRRLPSDAVEILGRTPLAGRQQMHLVRFGNKMLLVCVSPTGVDSLAEITDPIEIDRLAGLCAQTETSSATVAFKQIFAQLGREKPQSALSSSNREFSGQPSRRASAIVGEVTDV
ncbi:MAG TPA: flagellar biosynthetic protein FliO [Pirellulales bacterium]|nr:flagellar biosynthetic protein FliO [Pirellulales bacterium]